LKKRLSLHHQESRLKIKEFNSKGGYHPGTNESSSDSSSIDDIWVANINYDHPFLEIDRAPFTVMEMTSLSKIHFLFTMLNLSQLFVIRKGVLIGIITKNDFLKKKRMVVELQPLERNSEKDRKESMELERVIMVRMGQDEAKPVGTKYDEHGQ
jgi:hypothetical protein